MAPTSSILPEDVQSKLETLNANQGKWNALKLSEKLELLEKMNGIANTLADEDWLATGQWTAETMMGMSMDTEEGQFQKVVEGFYPLLLFKGGVEKIIDSYKMALGTNDNAKIINEKLQPTTSKANDKQVIYNVFPLLPKDAYGPSAGLNVEWWLDPEKVTSVDTAPAPFQVDKFEDAKSEGVLVVLGAGNQGFLTLTDLIEAMFVRQRVVLVKHHPLRGEGLDPLMRKLMKPLYDAGFLDSILDLKTVEQNSALAYHPLVNAIHMTGGKPTHDAIVWGSSPEEQLKNKQQSTPKLANAEMTSELGCVTPWVVTPGEYTAKELRYMAEISMLGIWVCASANCLAPKAIVMSEEWKQKDEFVGLLKSIWESHQHPIAYYPGSKQRWEAFSKAYPEASTIWHGKPSGPERGLSAPMMNAAKGEKEATLLPLLTVDVKADLSTEEGKAAAKKEYAFRNEAFSPVVALVTMPANNFMESATTLCNEYLYGSLSASISVPDACRDDPAVEQAIAGLKYGSIGVNMWTGFCYQFSWGGHPNCESLECVESGIGRVNNYLFIPHLQKAVVRAPSTWKLHQKIMDDYAQSKGEIVAVANFLRAPGALNLIKLLAATMPIPPAVKWGTVSAVVVAVAAFMMRKSGSE